MAASKQTEARWRAVVRDQEASGRSVKAFAEARGLSAATLYWAVNAHRDPPESDHEAAALGIWLLMRGVSGIWFPAKA